MPTSVNSNQKNSFTQASESFGWLVGTTPSIVGKFALVLSPNIIGLAASSYVLSRLVNIPMRQAVPAHLLSWGAGCSASLITVLFVGLLAQSRASVASRKDTLTVNAQGSLVGTVTGANFKKEVLQSKMPVVVDAYANWCPPCKAVAPIFASLSSEMKGKVKFVKFNVDEERSLAKDLNIEAMPTFLFYKNGECVGKHTGAMDKDGFRAKFGNYFV